MFISSVWVAEWPPFGKELHTWFTIYSFVFCLFVTLVIFRSGFAGWVLVLIAPVPGHCILVTFNLIVFCSAPITEKVSTPGRLAMVFHGTAIFLFYILFIARGLVGLSYFSIVYCSTPLFYIFQRRNVDS